jgi:hypothetical protein
MNRVGKIFVVSIAVMSIMFMAVSMVAYYTHRNWKAVIYRPQSDVKPGEPLGLKEQLKEANEKRSMTTCTRPCSLKMTITARGWRSWKGERPS